MTESQSHSGSNATDIINALGENGFGYARMQKKENKSIEEPENTKGYMINFLQKHVISVRSIGEEFFIFDSNESTIYFIKNYTKMLQFHQKLVDIIQYIWVIRDLPELPTTRIPRLFWCKELEERDQDAYIERLKDLIIPKTAEEKAKIEKDYAKQLTEFKKLEGEATANNRKAKLIFLYEWEFELKLKANVAGSDTVYDGVIEIPNLSDENDACEIDVNFNLTTKGPHENEIRHFGNHELRDFIRKQVGLYIRDLKEEFSKVVSSGKTVIDKAFQNEVVQKKDKVTEVASSGIIECKSFDAVETFKVPPERLYEILTDEQLVRAWTNGSGKVDVRPGGSFCLLGDLE
uniref:Activator of Hsp90 ATPase AHSA1-like N-terminal domain-containing protein n=1 Tax=Panagrolaimus sp. JU765 TaxID=591449 RepID=A0AC34RPD4_9BILA